MDWYYVDSSGAQGGPVDEHALRTLFDQAEITADCFAWSADLPEWTAIKDIPGGLLQRLQPPKPLQAPAAPPAPAPAPVPQASTTRSTAAAAAAAAAAAIASTAARSTSAHTHPLKNPRSAAAKIQPAKPASGNGRLWQKSPTASQTSRTVASRSDVTSSQASSQSAAHVTTRQASASQPGTQRAPLAPSKQSKPAHHWKELNTADGSVYFYNEVTNETTWDRPAELQCDNDDSSKDDWYWIPNDEHGFSPGRLVDTLYNGSRRFELQNGTSIDIGKKLQLHKLEWSSLKQNFDDLVMLSDINEPLVVHCVGERFKKNQIYTNVGTILVSVNPYASLGLYTPAMIEKYRTRGFSDISPHVFIIADEAYRNVLEQKGGQSIVISGESGAGKTEATKQCLQYLAECAGSENNVEQRILLANPILEAFGNAKTVRNNNSSRFGKYIEVFLDSNTRICGATNTNYLLEKSRVVRQDGPERNYHIFFQLCLGASEEQRKKYSLLEPLHYSYLNQCDGIHVENMDDAAEFRAVEDAMKTLGFSEEESCSIFKVIAAILHVGNIEFTSSGDRSCVVSECEESHHAMDCAARLLEVSTDALASAFTNRIMKIRGQDNTQIKLSDVEATGSRDATSKFIYAKMFDWIVNRVNDAVASNNRDKTYSIGVLDIFGFEIFQLNSFEQLCINFANEKLQQHFNRHTFKLEEQLYISEGIPFQRVEYIDNQPVLDLIEQKPSGIIPLLDEELRLPRTTDQTFMAKLHKQQAQSKHYKKVVRNPDSFVVFHYAGQVEYSAIGFMEKNHDTMTEDLMLLLDSSKFAFLKSMFKSDTDESKNKSRKKTIGSQFQEQLRSLSDALELTEPHYIRCIKPNVEKRPGLYNGKMVLEQLKYSGVFEAVEIRKSGFPFRLIHQQFVSRYRCTNLSMGEVAQSRSEVVLQCKELIESMGMLGKSIHVGKTKVLYRTQEHRQMELQRHVAVEKLVIKIQSIFRRFKVIKALKAWVKMRPVIRQAVAEENLDNLEKALDDSSIVHYEFPELQRARVLRAELIERIRVKNNMVEIVKLDPEEHYDRFEALLEQAEKCHLRDSIVDQVVKVTVVIRKRRACLHELDLAQKKRDESALRKSLATVAESGLSESHELVQQCRQLLRKLENDRKLMLALESATSRGGWVREGNSIVTEELKTAIAAAKDGDIEGKRAEDLLALAQGLVCLRERMRVAVGTRDQKLWARVEDVLGHFVSVDAGDLQEIQAAREEASRFAATDEIEKKLAAAMADRNLARTEFALAQAEKIGMLPSEFFLVAEASELLARMIECRNVMRRGVATVDPPTMLKAAYLAHEIQFFPPEIQSGIELGERLTKLQEEAIVLVETLFPEDMERVVNEAYQAGFESNEVKELAHILRDVSKEKFAQMQLQAAIRMQDGQRLADVTIKLKDMFFERQGDMFLFRSYPKLRLPLEWAGLKLFGLSLKKSAIAASFYRFSAVPIHAALTRDLSSQHEKLAKTMFKTLQCLMGDRMNNTEPLFLTKDIIAECLNSEVIRSEFYAQLVKQLSHNPSDESVRRGWGIMAVCLFSFPPPADLENYLECWIRASSLPPEQRELYLRALHHIVYSGAVVELPADDILREALHINPMPRLLSLMQASHANSRRSAGPQTLTNISKENHSGTLSRSSSRNQLTKQQHSEPSPRYGGPSSLSSNISSLPFQAQHSDIKANSSSLASGSHQGTRTADVESHASGGFASLQSPLNSFAAGGMPAASTRHHMPQEFSGSDLTSQALANSATVESIKDVSEETLWREAVDPSSGMPYYYHLSTGETTWTRPAEL